MDQKPIVLYLWKKEMALDDIHDDLVRTFRKDAVACPTVTKYVHNAQFSSRMEATPPEAPDVDSALSMRQYSRLLPNFRLCFCFCFCFRLCASFHGGFVFRDPLCTHIHTHTRTHTRTRTSSNHFASPCDIFDGSPILTAEQNRILVLMAIELLQVLSVQSTRQWHDIVTSEDSSIYSFIVQ
jgi:hypothetical protein